jgi:sulfite exporter TauE/SafE
MIWASVIAGFSLGLVGSLHCVGMCGPLALALPVQHLMPLKKFISLLIYQLGRIVTYAALGLLFGSLGRTLYVAGLQQWLSVSLGILILVSSLIYFLRKRTVHFIFLNRFYSMIQMVIAKLLQSGKGTPAFFLMGMANGFLPCGMVYLAIAGALSSVSIIHSVLFMALFGAGTLPAMMVVSYFGQAIPVSVRMSMRKAVPYFIAAMGLILLLRGLNLGIPFISPEMPGPANGTVSCHS